MGARLRQSRKAALILAAGQAIVGSAAPISIAMGGLAGFYLLGADKSLATAPVTGFNLGTALGALPAALLMQAVGRRNGFLAGTGITALGGAIAALALFEHQFWLLIIGLLLVGNGNAFVQQYRFAATDGAPSRFRPKAISWVLSGGVVAAVLGPQTVIHTRELFAPVSFAGAFVAVIGLAALGAIVLSFLRLPAVEARAATDRVERVARPVSAIFSQPRLIAAMVCGIGSYSLMSFVMTGAPLAMVGCGFSPDEATLGISWHVLAMYAPSFVTGRLIARFGKEAIIAAGLVLITGCAIVALSGIALWQFWTALVLLGIGWNLSFIGSTSIVTDCHGPAERSRTQGVHDAILFGTVALASLMSGYVYQAWGWEMLNWLVLPVVLACLVSLAVLVATRGRALPSPPLPAGRDNPH